MTTLDPWAPADAAPVVHQLGVGTPTRPPRRLPRPLVRLARVPRVGTWVGLGLVALGFVLITVAWGDTAGTEVVGDQTPYLVSAGLTGLAVICVGLTAVAIDAKLADAAARREQALELRGALAELRAVDEAAL